MDRHAAIVRQIDRRGRGAPIDRREPAGIAMGQHVDRVRPASCARAIASIRAEAMPADRLVDGDILLGDLAGARIGGSRRAPTAASGRSAARISSSAHFRLIAVGRVAISVVVGAIERRIGRIGAHRQRHAVGGGRADQRRAAHQHRADRVGRRVASRQPRHDEFMRQPPLVDRADRPAVGLEPDAADSACRRPSWYRQQRAVPGPPPHRAFSAARGSRASGAVISAVSSARSEPIGHGSCSLRKIPRQPRHQTRFAFSALAFSTRMMSLHRDRVMVGMPAIEIGHHGDARVANLGLAGELGLRHVGHADHRIAVVLVGHALGVASRIAGPPCRHRCRRARTRCLRLRAAAARCMRSRGDTGCAIETCATQPLPKNELSRR